jgi:hypothetical protein
VINTQDKATEMAHVEAGTSFLTPEEREALIVASIELNALHCWEENHSAALRGLLARLSPPADRPDVLPFPTEPPQPYDIDGDS